MTEPLKFAEERPSPASEDGAPWQVLVVDDDAEVHAVTRLMLEHYRFQDRGVTLLPARSAAEARALLARHPGIALVLLDVVMETEHAGLELARHIRGELGNRAVRIALRTGQPGQAPPQQVVVQYDIDDYLPKSELRFQRLHILVTSALRTFSLLRRLEAQAAELRRSNEELDRFAHRDPLTGLMNRRRFEQALDGEWRRVQRQALPVCALMMDVDNFKAYNDNYGHPAGDRILQQVARVLTDQFARPGDSVCRYGGEEFLALLPGMLPVDGVRQAERARAAIEALRLEHGHSPHRVITISVGCGFAEPAATAAEALIKGADQALYRAKKKGRNRVESSG